MTETKQVLCGYCRVNIEERTDPNGQIMAVCPSCGNADTLNNAIREAGEYFTDKLMREAFSPDRFPKSNFVTVTVTHDPERQYRFITD